MLCLYFQCHKFKKRGKGRGAYAIQLEGMRIQGGNNPLTLKINKNPPHKYNLLTPPLRERHRISRKIGKYIYSYAVSYFEKGILLEVRGEGNGTDEEREGEGGGSEKLIVT